MLFSLQNISPTLAQGWVQAMCVSLLVTDVGNLYTHLHMCQCHGNLGLIVAIGQISEILHAKC